MYQRYDVSTPPNALRDYIMENVEDERICTSDSLRHLIIGIHNQDSRGAAWWAKRCETRTPPRGEKFPPGPPIPIPGHKIESTLIRYRRKSKRPKPRTKPDDSIHISDKDQKALNKLMNNKNVLCKPRKTVVELKSPKPNMELKPHCVYIRQCGGCCDSDLLECRPTEVKSRKFKVLNVTPKSNGKVSIAMPPLVRARAVEHKKCECQCKIQESDCNSNQQYDDQNCRCVCPKGKGSRTTCPNGKVWSDSKCDCVCQNQRSCTTGMIFNDDSCKCDKISDE
ncbi:unnamed protein product [Meganyctiphanes norvegica]|uniref:Platelet-derived growth factor (PDGF) family profile domain-containing protein n=1 Tax=Meganyctiphanes norvegica TaxID=48144 RepID=A0AAV2R6J9_MEGNR